MPVRAGIRKDYGIGFMEQKPTASSIPVMILTGFLGAGKTSLLNHLLHADHNMRVAVLENDFGSINIDSQMVVGVEDDMISLANGCICCTIRGDLLEAVLKLLDRQPPPEYIIIETSGVADPAGVASTFLLPQVQPYLHIDSILTVFDAEQGGDRLERELFFLAMDQIGVADIVVINKTDLVSAERLAAVKSWVREIVPRARLIETTHGRVPPALVLGAGTYDLRQLDQRTPRDVHVHEAGASVDHAHPEPDHSLVFETWSWVSDQPLALKPLRRVVENLPLSIFRAKGFVWLADAPDRRALLQVVGKRVTLTFGEPWGSQTPITQIVVIGEHGGVDAADLQTRFDAALAANNPPTELSRVKDAVLGWLRGRR
jgi:G3E family GTPase